MALRKTLLVSLYDLLAVVREFLNPNASRSGMDRCLRRHGVGNLRDLQAKTAPPRRSGFKAQEPGYLHIDVKYLPQMADESARRYLFVAIDRAIRWVFIRIFKAKTAANARRLPHATWSAPARSGFGPFCQIGPLERHWSERQWRGQGVHRSPVRPAQARGHRRTRVRQALRRAEHRASIDPAQVAANQRYGRALQPPDRGGAAKPPLPVWRGAGDHTPSICLALQPAAPAISLG